jgi:predicted dehydrogenase
MHNKVRIAVIGLGFGAAFAEIYSVHPDVEYVGVCDTNPATLDWAKSRGFTRLHTSFNEILASPDYNAVHLCLPVTMHVEPTLAVLRAGKYCACAVPMAMSIEDLERIIAAQEQSGLNYMMMETMVYGHHYLYAQELLAQGRLGKIQLLRGCHSQDLEDINPVWRGLPPMWYMTHAVSPLLDILDTQATAVCCFGSGRMRPEFTKPYGNPYPIETAIFSLRDTDVKAEVTRTLFETAPYGGEAFDIYGDLGTFATIGQDVPVLSEISPLTRTGEERYITISEQLVPNPYHTEGLPEPIRHFRGHGGSHPHLAHEFVRSIVEARPPYIHARRAAAWCAPGICAHASAMKDGEKVSIPEF